MIGTPPESAGALHVKVIDVLVAEESARPLGLDGTAAARTLRVAPRGPAPWTLTALTAN